MDHHFYKLVWASIFLTGLWFGLFFAPHFYGQTLLVKQDRLSLPCPSGEVD